VTESQKAAISPAVAKPSRSIAELQAQSMNSA
jgi:hypothetical protein